MKRLNGGQSGHKPGDDRSQVQLAAEWLDVPDEFVWAFAVELNTKYKLRDLATITGVRRETLRKFINRTGTPSYATRKSLAELYLEFNAGGVVSEEDGSTRQWKARRRLIELLPPGQEAAREELDRLFELAKQGEGLSPELIERLHEWLDLQVRGEYSAEERHRALASGERQRQPRGKAKRPRKPKAKPPEDEGGE